MFYVGIILPFTTVFLSASSIYSERKEPNLYEGMLYSDSSQDENKAAIDYPLKRKDKNESWNSFATTYRYELSTFVFIYHPLNILIQVLAYM